jgi:hypothetical protein
MNPSPSPPPDAVLLVVGLPALWVGVMALLSRVGGWSELAETHPSRDHPIDEVFRFASLGLGAGWFPVNYSRCLSVSVGPEGFGVSLWIPFRPFHPNIFIPWRAVESCRAEKFFFVPCTAVYLSRPRTRLLFRGRLGRALQVEWAKFEGMKSL